MNTKIIAQKSTERYKISSPNRAPNATATVAWIKEFLQIPNPTRQARLLLNLWRSTDLPIEEFFGLVVEAALEIKGVSL